MKYLYIRDLFLRAKNNKMLVNGSLFSLFSFIEKGIGFVLLIILAKFIMPSEYGMLSIFNTIVTFIGLFICLSTDGYLSISYFRCSENEFRKDVGAVFVVMTFMITIFALIICLFGGGISSKLEIPVYFLWIAVLISVLSCIFNIHQNMYIIKEKVVKYGVFSTMFALLNLALSLALVIGIGHNWIGRVEAQLIALTLLGGVSLLLLIRDKCMFFHNLRDSIKNILLYGIPMIPHLATVWIKQGLDQFIIKDTHTIYDVGIFSFALNLTGVIVMLGVAFNSTNSVALFKILSDKSIFDKRNVLEKKTKQMVLLYLGASAVIVVAMHLLIILFMPKYIESIPYFYMLSIYGLLQCFYLLYCNYFFYYKKTKNLMYITFSTSIAHLCLSLLFTRYSLYNTALIYIFSQLCIVASVYYYGKQLIVKNVELNG